MVASAAARGEIGEAVPCAGCVATFGAALAPLDDVQDVDLAGAGA